MKSITINEIENMNPESMTVVDIRKEVDYKRQTFPGAVNIPLEEFQDNLPKIDKSKPVYVLCYTGEHSEEVFLVMNPGYNSDNWKIIQDNAKLLGIPLTVFESDIFNIVVGVDKNPCYLCARMRRGFLYSHAKRLRCNKIALGHHFDDVIETILMGMLYSGKIETMMPKLHSTNFEGMELIRPLYMVKEEDIKTWRDYNGLYFIQCACRFTENCASCGGGRGSKRNEMKDLISRFRETSDVIESNIFKSVYNINLRTVIGYQKDGKKYNFLDDYDSMDI